MCIDSTLYRLAGNQWKCKVKWSYAWKI